MNVFVYLPSFEKSTGFKSYTFFQHIVFKRNYGGGTKMVVLWAENWKTLDIVNCQNTEINILRVYILMLNNSI